MKANRNLWVFVVVALLVGMASFWYTGALFKGTSREPYIVRIGSFSTAIDYAPLIVAKSKGWFDEAAKLHGASVSFTEFQSLPPINESFATKNVDVVFEAEPPAIVGKAAGIDLKIVALGCSLIQEVLVPSASSAASVVDLKGKKVAVLAGTSSHYGLLKIANTAGVPASSITVLNMVPPDAKAAFASGQVDAWAVWPPWVEQELVAGTGKLLRGGDAKIHSIVVFRGDFLRDQSKLAEAIIGVIDQSRAWIRDNPSKAQQIVATELGLDPKVVSLAWPKHDWGATFTDAVIRDIQEKATFLSREKLIQHTVDVRDNFIVPMGKSR